MNLEDEMHDLKFPIGECEVPKIISDQDVQEAIEQMKTFPEKVTRLTNGITDAQKQKTYRPQGWTLAQVVHHCADSHMNSYIRFKWALTEDEPLIKAYHEDRWAEHPDGKEVDLEASLALLKGLHKRWVTLLSSLSEAQLNRGFIHPETKMRVTLKENILVYAWHCKHHLAHIDLALQNK